MGGLIISPLSHPSKKKSPIQSKICCKRQIKNDHKLIWIRIRISGGAFFFPLGNRCLSQSVYIDFYCQTLAHTHMYKYQITGTNCSHAAESGDSCDIFIQPATSCQEVELTNQKKKTQNQIVPPTDKICILHNIKNVLNSQTIELYNLFTVEHLSINSRGNDWQGGNKKFYD